MTARSYHHHAARDDETEIVVTFDFAPGCPPARDDPGSGAEVEITGAVDAATGEVLYLTEAERERITAWLGETFEPDTGPDPDRARDEQIDDELTGRGR